MTERKKYILISAAVAAGLLGITFISVLSSQNRQESDTVAPEIRSEWEDNQSPSIVAPEPEPTATITTINGFKERARELPPRRINLIEQNLLETIRANIQGGPTVSDAVIRNGTYRQELHDAGKQIYRTTFIVDIPSLKQSYWVDDYYSPLPADVSGLYDYSTIVSCLAKKDLIYDEFDCQDRLKAENARP